MPRARRDEKCQTDVGDRDPQALAILKSLKIFTRKPKNNINQKTKIVKAQRTSKPMINNSFEVPKRDKVKTSSTRTQVLKVTIVRESILVLM